MRSVGEDQSKEVPERPHRRETFRNRGVRGRYVPGWGGDRADRPTGRAVRQVGTAENWKAKDSSVSCETLLEKVGEQEPDPGISPQESRRLAAQCSILVVIAGIVSWLIAA
jgi:hypothetical protein